MRVRLRPSTSTSCVTWCVSRSSSSSSEVTLPSKILPAMARRASPGEVCARSRPSRITANRGHSTATSSTMWVESSTMRFSASSASRR